MSRPSKKEFSMANDDGSTNAFIENIAKSAPKSEKPKDQEIITDRAEQNEAWTSDIYSRLNGTGPRKPGHNCCSVLVMAFSVLLLLIGAGVIAVAAMEKEHKLLPVCPQCATTLLVLYIIGGFIIFVGLVGTAAASTRSKIIAIPFMLLMILLSLAFLAMTIVAIAFQANVNGLHLDSAWESDVTNDPSSVCDIQNRLKCSGFKYGCCSGHNVNRTTAAPVPLNETTTEGPSTTSAAPTTAGPTTATTTTTGAPTESTTFDSNFTTTTTVAPGEGTCYTSVNGVPPEWVSKVCVPDCVPGNSYTTLCDDAIRDEIKSHLAIVLGILIPLALIMFVIAGASIRMTRAPPESRYYE